MRDFFEELKRADDIPEFISEHKKEAVKIAALAVGVMTVLMLLLYRGGDDVELTETATPFGSEEAGTEASMDRGTSSEVTDGSADAPEVKGGSGDVYVDIGGAVNSPKLAKLSSGSRVEDAINEAGGLTAEADISVINRAEVVADGQKIYIPTKDEVKNGTWGSDGKGANGAAGASSSSGNVTGDGAGAVNKVNINSADITQLQTITGVGPVTAQKIIDYRTQNGNFSKIEDLKNVSGIGDKTFENMKDQVTV